MKPNLIIFDMDDVMWNLNEKVAKVKGIDHNKLICFAVRENPNLTEDEKQLVLDAYTETEVYSDIEFIKPVINLINRIYHEFPEYPVHIVSNCGTQAIRNVKMEQLLNVLDLPEEQIHLYVIDMETGAKKKTLPDNIFIFVDDSPHNIASANAAHKIMPARLHNDVLVVGSLEGCTLDRPMDSDELVETVMDYILEGR